MRNTALAICACLLVTACETMPHRGSRQQAPVTYGHTPSPTTSPLARSTTYTCEDNSTIAITEGERVARVTMNSGAEVNLSRRSFAGGSVYGAPPQEFRVHGSDGQWHVNGRVIRCRVK